MTKTKTFWLFLLAIGICFSGMIWYAYDQRVPLEGPETVAVLDLPVEPVVVPAPVLVAPVKPHRCPVAEPCPECPKRRPRRDCPEPVVCPEPEPVECPETKIIEHYHLRVGHP